jgi:hypothetical protein
VPDSRVEKWRRWLVNRMIGELGQVRVYDSGADGNPDTAADNQLFVTQGVFVP